MARAHVTGIGGTTGIAPSIEESLEMMFSDQAATLCAPTPFTDIALDWGREEILAFTEKCKSPIPQELESVHNRSSQMAGYAAVQALQQAGLQKNALENKRVGVVIGTTVGCSMNNVPFYKAYKKHLAIPTDEPQPELNAIQTFLSSNPSEIIAEMLEVHGPTQTVVNACASGTDALGVGMQWIESGLCDIVLAGGCDALSQVTMNGFNSLMVMDENRCKPFDMNRKGLNLGEGSAILVLESDKHVKQRGATSLARLIGYGSGCDAHHLTAPHPEGLGLQKALQTIIDEPHFSQDDLAFVNVHGTGTKNNDAVESHVMANLFGTTPFFSSKGATGHTLGAAGAIEAAFCILCLQKGKIPATIGLETPDPELKAHPVQATTTVSGSIALSTSLAFGGLASAIAIQLGEHNVL